MLTTEELERYKRHTILPLIGREGQEKLKKASVLVVGTGGLGSPILMYLAASGIGKIGIVDFDVVDSSNLQRQIIHKTGNIDMPKVDSAREMLLYINPFVKINTYNEALTSDNALSIIENYDIVCDGTDNFQTRYLVNDACVIAGKTNVFGSIRQFEGQVSIFGTTDGPCYRCLFPEPPEPGTVPSCAEAGVMGVLPGVIGTIQATEVIKLICNIGEALIGRLLQYDALSMKFDNIRFAKDEDCPCCGNKPSITELMDYDAFCGTTFNASSSINENISARELKALINSAKPPLIIDVRETEELREGFIDGSLHIAMNDIPQQVNKIPKNKPVVIYCHSGIRSRHVIQYLKQHDYNNLTNLTGGIEAWDMER
ncbi:molybdopterin-synthase adenylyltransferase MoeB [Carboxylicivirga sp. N1Y90]|uniref:molybdopterin-synthase adenylyltransferase MoeB n=1 Tax=Carboxylicivirga fragile TaxID=3417571 RepID=UPI003D357262|nr:molybdopterin-synthase adenylyltransferase MoeB [Marinilabiliaceae bacterium N1Y90]